MKRKKHFAINAETKPKQKLIVATQRATAVKETYGVFKTQS